MCSNHLSYAAVSGAEAEAPDSGALCGSRTHDTSLTMAVLYLLS